MHALLLTLALVAAPAERPSWYGGRHAVLVVVDGLGDGAFDRLRAAGHLPKASQRFVDRGWRERGVAAHWPGRGVDEARSVARGQRLDLDADDSFAPPGVERWPVGSFSVYGAERGNGLAALLKELTALGRGERPPVLAVVHERGYAAAVARHGAQSVEAGRALGVLDRRLEAVAELYRARRLADDTVIALVSPAGLAPTTRRLDVEAMFVDLRRRDSNDSARLTSLLKSFEPVEIHTRGGLALVVRRAQSAAPAPGAATWTELLEAAGLPKRRGPAMLGQIARTEGVALVVARRAARAPTGESLLVMSRDGQAELERREPDQLRYRVVEGRDPLQLGDVPAALGTGRFHAEAVWRAATADRPWADAPARVARLLDMDEGAALAVVAEAGFSFDDRGPGAAPSGKALSLWSGPGLVGEGDEVTRTLDAMPTLMALVGAPLDPRLEGEVSEGLVTAGTGVMVRGMCRSLVARATAAFAGAREHDASVIDTTEMRRFGTPPAYFSTLRWGLGQGDPLALLPEEPIQRQIGPRRSLLIVATAVSSRLERLVIKHAPNDIRRFDPLIRPEFMLDGFLADPEMRSRLRILEGPRQRALARAAVAAEEPAAEP